MKRNNNNNCFNPNGTSGRDKFYILPEELSANAYESQQLSCCTEEFGADLLKISDKVLSLPSFRNYAEEEKEDMKSFNIYRWLKRGIYSMDVTNPRLFSYITHGTIMNYLVYIGKMYKQRNQHKEYIKTIYQNLMLENGYSENNIPKSLKDQLDDI